MPNGTEEKVPLGIDPELNAMRIVGEAIEGVTDPDARARVLSWVASRFGIPHPGPSRKELSAVSGGRSAPVSTDDEIPGIARATANGGIEITVRDLKAKSTTDAAIRLAHIVIYASEKLREERAVSSRKVLLPILKEWRAYDGNTRLALARHKGIHRDGDLISLDAIAKKDAEKYVSEVLDEATQGTWNPNGRSARKPSTKKIPAAREQANL
jgi:hypothetical protein